MRGWELFWYRVWVVFRWPIAIGGLAALFVLTFFFKWVWDIIIIAEAIYIPLMAWKIFKKEISRWFKWQFIEPFKTEEEDK